ncbi:MAG TPA: hemolysin family protein [Candidatus Obscuribacterales bacterium]
MSTSTVLLWLGVMVLFLVLNGLFVAIEFALIALRRSRVKEMVENGERSARTIDHLQKDIDTSIAGAQLGITLASLALGWVGEHSIQEAVKLLLGFIPGLTGVQPPAGLGFVVSFVLLSILHVVIGEQVPKSWALRVPERMAVTLAVPFRLFCLVAKPLIWVMNGMASLILRLLGIPKVSGEPAVHSADELEILIEASNKAGTLGKQESDLLKRALELKELTARQIMIPRPKMDRISESLSLPEVLAVVSRTKHSKLPVYKGNDDNIIGILNTRDLFDWWHAAQKAAATTGGTVAGKDFRLSAFVRQAHFVPEALPASALLEFMRTKKIQMVLVVDEFGGTAGLITLEDLVEQLVGEIWDEYDTPIPGVQKLADNRWHLSGELTLLEVNKALGTEITCASCITIAGAVIEALGSVPKIGDSVEIAGWRFTILEMNRNAIAKLETILVPPPAPAPEEPQPAA